MAIQSKFPTLKPSLLLDFANTKRLDPRITFTRASTATYWDGVTQVKAEENLLKYSQEFGSAAGWINGATTCIADQATAPDGTTTADLVYPTTTGTLREIYSANQTLTGTHTLSVYVKSAGFRWVYLAFTAGVASTTAASFFDVIDGLVGTNGSVYNETITAVGNGWFRLSITIDSTAIPRRFNLGFADADYSFTATASGTSGVFLWGAQLEQRSQATAYTPTTDKPITKYQPVLRTAASGVPRFDHDPVTGESLGLLIEEQRTNLLTYSEQFDNAAWGKANATVIANAAVAPDGTLTADKLVTTATTTRCRVGVINTEAAQKTLSCYAKAGEWGFVGIGFTNGSGLWSIAVFNLLTGVHTNTANLSTPTISSYSISSVGNGWYRVSVTITGATSAAVIMPAFTSGDIVNPSYTGDGTSGIYIWGAQLEAGSFPTSYIPTTSAQVTRAADSASMTGTNFSSWYRQDEGTLFAKASSQVSSGTTDADFVEANDGTQTNYFGTRAGITQGFTAGAVVSVAANGTSRARNGIITAISQPTNQPPKTRLQIGFGRLYYMVPGWYRRIAYYPKKLSDSELQALTA